MWLLGGACMVAPGGHACFIWGGMRGFIRGACVVLFGGCVVLFGDGVCSFIWGGMRGFFQQGGHAWFYSAGGHAWFYSPGGMRGFFSYLGYNEIRSMSGRYASYWNAFLFTYLFISKQNELPSFWC